jgi:cytochrome c oxidase cbb3-type subunit 3
MLARRYCSHIWIGLALLLCAGLASSSLAQQHDFWGEGPKTAATPGQRTFNANCAGCHGLDGRGGDKGPNIAASVLSDAQLSTIISKGIAGTAMPGFPDLSQRQIRAIIGSLRTLQGKLEERTPPGDGARGKVIFFGKGECSNCHTFSGEGGFLGPDLSAYGSDISAKAIRDEILRPDRVARAGYRSALITTRNGNRLEGVIRNEDNFSLQLLAPNGSFHFLQKSDLQKIEQPGQSLMPTNYRERLTSTELNDLVSYLMNAVFTPHPASNPTQTENPPE